MSGGQPRPSWDVLDGDDRGPPGDALQVQLAHVAGWTEAPECRRVAPDHRRRQAQPRHHHRDRRRYRTNGGGRRCHRQLVRHVLLSWPVQALDARTYRSAAAVPTGRFKQAERLFAAKSGSFPRTTRDRPRSCRRPLPRPASSRPTTSASTTARTPRIAGPRRPVRDGRCRAGHGLRAAPKTAPPT